MTTPLPRLTKILCTLGPAVGGPEKLQQLADQGMNIARVNMSHGTREQHASVVESLHALNAKRLIPVGILLDSKGCEIRSADVAEPFLVEDGEEVIFTSKDTDAGTHKVIRVQYDGFSKDVKHTKVLLLDNGAMTFEILEYRPDGSVLARSRGSGLIGSRRHINLPGVDISLPSITDKDWDDFAYAATADVDFIALSFVRTAKDMTDVREFLEKKGAHIHLIAKIETQQAVENIDSIIEASDGVMVARGDLGAEVPFELVPAIQDDIVRKCRMTGKPVIVATHMLESMTEHPMPTRAEATDVAHAAATGSDATMLSGETASGKHPFKALEAMHRILLETESHMRKHRDLLVLEEQPEDEKESRAEAAVMLAKSTHANAILVFTRSGKSALDVSKYRPSFPIIAVTDSFPLQRRLQLAYGIFPLLLPFAENPETTLLQGIEKAKEAGLVHAGQHIVLLSDTLIDTESIPTIQVHTVS